MVVGAVTPLIERLVDDAGLFPPAALPLDQALTRFRAGNSPVLSRRFICPASRLDELADVLAPDERIDVHVLCDLPVEPPEDPRLVVRAVEARHIAATALPCYVEDVPSRDIKACGRFAKLRCGGAAVPSTSSLAAFIRECVRLNLPFKATAGLHAAVRGWEHDEDGTPHHGFLNLLLAVCAALVDGDVEKALDATDARQIADAVRRTPDTLAAAARGLIHSIGSCDTVRPTTDLQRLGLL